MSPRICGSPIEAQMESAEGAHSSSDNMTCLSLRQPWLELILNGQKTIEVRTWRSRYRGPLLLHASRSIDWDACVHFGIRPDSLATGALLGSVELVDCVTFTRDTWQSLAPAHLNYRDFRPGLIGWFFRDPQRLEPTPFRGQLGLFKVPGALLISTGQSPSFVARRRL